MELPKKISGEKIAFAAQWPSENKETRDASVDRSNYR